MDAGGLVREHSRLHRTHSVLITLCQDPPNLLIVFLLSESLSAGQLQDSCLQSSLLSCHRASRMSQLSGSCRLFKLNCFLLAPTLSQRARLHFGMTKSRNLRNAALSILAVSSCICAYCTACEPLLVPRFKMRATGAASILARHTGSVTAPRIPFWQIPGRYGFRKRLREKYFSKGIAGSSVSITSLTHSGPKAGRVLPYCYLAGYVPSFFASSQPFCRESRSMVFDWDPRYGRRLYSQHHYSTVGSPLSTTPAGGGRHVDSFNSAYFSSLTGSACRSSDLTSGGLKHSNEEIDVVELEGEIVPSRVKGPVSRFTVCLLHGLLGSRRNMRTLGSFLASPRVLAWDLRNHGQSAWRETMSIDELARDVLYNLHERACFFRTKSARSSQDLSSNFPSQKSVSTTRELPSQVVLVGHSLGGLAAMRAAVLEASRKVDQSHCSIPQPAAEIAGIVILDIAPIDYSTTLEQERFRAHQEKTGFPGTDDIVRLLHDIPMHLFENRRQLEKTLLTSTDPSLPPSVVSWLMTGVLEGTADDSGKRSKMCTTAEAAGPSTEEIRHSHAVMHSSLSGRTLPRQSETCTLRWRMNIRAIRRMLASKQLRWHFPDSSALAETEHPSHCRGGAALQSQPLESRCHFRENADNAAAFAYHRSSNRRQEIPRKTRLQAHVDCGAYGGPTLFLKGSDSPYIDLERHWGEILKVFPNAKCKVIPGAGHWLHTDKPQLTADYINEFLTSV